MAGILTTPKRVDTLPAKQRPRLGARQTELDTQVKEAMKPLLANRDIFYQVAEAVTSTSSIYEAFRRAGCTVRVVRRENETVEGKNRKGELVKYPVCDIFALLPKGEIRNQSKRKPWVRKDKKSMNQAGEVKA